MGTDANRFIGRIKYQVLNLSDRLRLPRRNLFIELLCQPADLGRADFGATKNFDDILDPAGTYSFDIHFGDGELESALTAHAFLDAAGIKLHPANLWYFQEDFPGRKIERLVFKSIGMPSTLFRAFIWFGVESLCSLDLHGLIDDHFDNTRKFIVPIRCQDLDHLLQKCIL